MYRGLYMNKDIELISERYESTIKEETLGSGTMSVEKLKDYLLDLKGTTHVNVEMESSIKMNKKSKLTGNPNPYLGVVKHSVINGTAGGDYEIGAQNKELEAHADDPNYMPTFKSEPIWHGKGKRISSLLVQHIETGEYYLVIGNIKQSKSELTFNGQPIEKSELEEYITPPKNDIPPKQAAVGITDKQEVRYIALKNIRNIKINNVDLNVI